MSINQRMISELKVAIYSAFPGIESQLQEAFRTTDVTGDDSLPYNVVEALLRHFLMKCGLIEYIVRYATPEGTLSLKYIRNALKGSSMADLTDASGERMISYEEMTTLAILWLKIISDDYQADNAKKTPTATGGVLCGLTCGAEDETSADEANYLVGDEILGMSSVDGPAAEAPALEPVVPEPEPESQWQEQSFEQSEGSAKFAGCGQFQTEPSIGVTSESSTVLLEKVDPLLPRYAADVIGELINMNQDEAPGQIDEYIRKLFDHIEQNKAKGIKCFVYPATITPDGACASAGAVPPQRRRPRTRKSKQQRPLMGCC